MLSCRCQGIKIIAYKGVHERYKIRAIFKGEVSWKYMFYLMAFFDDNENGYC